MNPRDYLEQRIKKVVLLEQFPEPGEVFLRQRRVFTLPNKPGLMFILMLVVLFIASTNYSLNLGFALTYVLGGCAWVNTFYGFRNLAYLHLLPGVAPPVFAGEEAQYTLHIVNRRKNHRYAIHIGFADNALAEQTIDIAPESQVSIQLAQATTQRGWQAIPRVRLQTWFPLGMLRVWSTWLPDMAALVYPQPEANPPPLPLTGVVNGEGQGHAGDEDFSGVRAYQNGDALKHLAWKHIARVDLEAGGHLITKQFSGGSASDLLLDFNQLSPHLDLELRLSRMTSWVLTAEAQQRPYAFRLDSIFFAANNGEAHQAACLQALALYGMDQDTYSNPTAVQTETESASMRTTRAGAVA